jgi:tetratricopeptide (TPR) repeat protein
MDRLQIIKEMIASGDQDPFLKFALAKETEKTDLSEAIKIYEDLRAFHPDYIGLYYHLGKALEQVGIRDEAKEIYRIGVANAKRVADFHSLSELNTALQGLDDED